jgi:hypothetical protein
VKPQHQTLDGCIEVWKSGLKQLTLVSFFDALTFESLLKVKLGYREHLFIQIMHL